MAGQGRRRLILCGICFMPGCKYSRWVDEDDGMLIDAIDELHMLFIECQHSEMEQAEAKKLTVEERQERITEAIAQIEKETGQSVEIENLDTLLGKQFSREGTEKAITEKDLSPEDMLSQFTVEIQRPDEQQERH